MTLCSSCLQVLGRYCKIVLYYWVTVLIPRQRKTPINSGVRREKLCQGLPLDTNMKYNPISRRLYMNSLLLVKLSIQFHFSSNSKFSSVSKILLPQYNISHNDSSPRLVREMKPTATRSRKFPHVVLHNFWKQSIKDALH